MRRALFGIAIFVVALGGCSREIETPNKANQCPVSLLVLGVAQDGGKPQVANPDDPAWKDPSLRRLATSLALIDRRGEKTKRWLFEATPDIKEQLQKLDHATPVDRKIGLDGIFLTHAHIGHYTGLMMFGHEAVGAKNLLVYAMPHMADFLSNNGPWSQLLIKHNIIVAIMAEKEPENIADGIAVTPFLVPHRQEFSEVAGYRIEGPGKSALFIPDIDSWEEWDGEGTRIEDMIASVDVAYLDATFYGDGEIPGRDMSGFPHPFVNHSMARFSGLPSEEKAKVRFIHMNHTNPLLNPVAREREFVRKNGFSIADEGEAYCLLEQ